jgi:hypothetical protein
MRVTIEIDSQSELDKLSALFKTLKISTINVNAEHNLQAPIIKGDKKLNPKDIFGIWGKNPKNIDAIRKSAWQRDQKL